MGEGKVSYLREAILSLAIRPAEVRDIDTIVAYNMALALETEGIALQAERVWRGVQALLEDDRKGFYLVAEMGGVVVGQIMVTFEWSDWRNGVFFWIQSVYVRPDRRRRGVFRALYGRVEATARARPDACGLRLYVMRDNGQAQETYRSLGMSRTPFEMLEVDFVIERHGA